MHNVYLFYPRTSLRPLGKLIRVGLPVPTKATSINTQKIYKYSLAYGRSGDMDMHPVSIVQNQLIVLFMPRESLMMACGMIRDKYHAPTVNTSRYPRRTFLYSLSQTINMHSFRNFSIANIARRGCRYRPGSRSTSTLRLQSTPHNSARRPQTTVCNVSRHSVFIIHDETDTRRRSL